MKITKALREHVSNKVASSIYDKKIESQENKIRKLGNEISKKLRENANVPQRLIDQGYVSNSVSIRIKMSDRGYDYKSLTVDPFPDKMRESCTINNPNKNILNAINSLKDIKNKKYGLEQETLGILQAFTTVKSCIENLPELKKYFPKESNGSTALIPMEKIKSFRNKLK